jgi:DNA-binding transcriptional regulator YdaS (Cro superfamily)
MSKSKRPLTVTQQSAINLLVIGNTQEETARILGISPSVINQWINHSNVFKSELAVRRRQLQSRVTRRVDRNYGDTRG